MSSEIRPLPRDLDAEMAVLGAIVCDPGSLDRVRHNLASSAFSLPRNGVIFEACLALSDRSESITVLTLRTELESRGVLDQVGGLAFLGKLTDYPTAAGIESHAELVRRCALARSVIET